MRSERRLRRLVVDGGVHRWSVRHRHAADGPCQEVLTLYREGARTLVVFRAGPGRVVEGAYWHSGLVGDEHGNTVNLHRPGVVRAFVDELRERAWPGAELDGWELLPAVAVRCAAAATPGVPPDCPPGP
ncbi:hypothetical protein [Streptomyces sp. NPDC018610]|uniref:hypothetical protein n=1 Tax=Streptomyces sp. NPDC018610 TaxID=3365049 RepID=UPI0037996DF2